MVAENVFFGVVAAMVAVAAVLVVTTRNVVHAALYLVAVLAGIGVNFLLLGAEFVGVTQVLVYIGAIVVLFLFGIMLTKAPLGGDAQLTGKTWLSGLVVAVALAGVLGFTLIDAYGDDELPDDLHPIKTADISDTIFGPYLVAFEVASVLLLAALVGAIVLARRD